MTLQIPSHYLESHSVQPEYHANISSIQTLAQDWARQNNLKSVKTDKKRVYLLGIDMQDDFSYPSGSLYVAGRSGTGAMDNAARLSEWIYRNLDKITDITLTMDSHLPWQVFFPNAHVMSDGTSPAPFTMVSSDDYRSGKYHASPLMAAQLGTDQNWLTRQFTYYCEELEKTGRFALTLWPHHCLLGSFGHKLSGVVDEARLFHSFARGATNYPEVKGGNPLTEHYSIFKAEVNTTWDGHTLSNVQKNVKLLQKLTQEADYLVIAGEAQSHCVSWSVRDVVDYALSIDPSLTRKIYLLKDCTSPVVIPGIVDYTDAADKDFDDFRNLGVNIVESTVPMEQWSNMIL